VPDASNETFRVLFGRLPPRAKGTWRSGASSYDDSVGAIHGSCFSASHAARCVACHGVRSHPVPVALDGECYIRVV